MLAQAVLLNQGTERFTKSCIDAPDVYLKFGQSGGSGCKSGKTQNSGCLVSRTLQNC
jgi:hypothetical protein